VRCPHCGTEIPSDADAKLAKLCERFTLTDRQRDVLACFLRLREEGQGVAPTLDEMGAALGISRVNVFEHVRALQRKGVIKRSRSKRSIQLVA